MQKNDLDILARTLYGEARGEGDEGLEAVANVIMNRYKKPKWYTGYVLVANKKIPSIAETCLKKAQFSCWNKNDVNFNLLQQVSISDDIFKKCILVAQRAINGDLVDFTNEATFYHTKNIIPKWAKGHSPCYECGNHLFYNDVR